MAVSFAGDSILNVTDYFKNIRLIKMMSSDKIGDLYRLDEYTQRGVALQITSAIYFLHNQDQPILQKGFKPENILINSSAEIKICDFGYGRFSDLHEQLCSSAGKPEKGILQIFNFI